jgi:hypothetical protein
MTSQINPNNIDGNYPVAGISNNSQGMRDNFTNTKTNFQYAADEISELQTNGVFKAALAGTTLDNNMADNLIYAVKLQDVSWTQIPIAATAGSVTIDYSAAQYQSLQPTGSVGLGFANWPASGSAGSFQLSVTIVNTAYTLTLPIAVSQGIESINGISPGTPGVSNTISYATTGTYVYEFTSINGGNTISIRELIVPFSTSITNSIFNGTSEVTIGSSNGNANVTINGTSNVAVFTTTGISVVGNVVSTVNVTGGNILTAGIVSSAGTITGGGLNTAGAVSATGNVTGSNMLTGGLVSATGNVTGGNIISGAAVNAVVVSASGNVTGGNIISGAAVNAVVVSASGNITGGNINTAGLVSATGNVTGGNVIATGSVNGRIIPRISSTASASSVTPDVSSYDIYAFNALAATLTINAPTGSPSDGEKLTFRILDNGTPQTLTWNGTYTAIGVTIPGATTANKTIYVGCVYNANATRWDVVAVTTQL